MAYKFQLGAARLSGSVVQEGDVTVEDGGITIPNSSTIGCAADDDLITFAAQSVAFANDADINIAKAGGLQIAGTAVTSTAAELNILDGVTATASELNLVDGSSAGSIVNSKAVIHGSSGEVNATTFQISGTDVIDSSGNIDASNLHGNGTLSLNAGTNTVSSTELLILSGATVTTAELNILDGVTSTAAELNILDGVTATAAELNYLDGADSSISSLSLPDNVTITSFAATILDDADEATFKATVNLEIGTDVQAYDADLDNLSGMQAGASTALAAITSAEIGYLDGVSSANNTASKLVLLDGSGNLVLAGNLTVQGTTTTVDSTTINVSSSFTFEGVADDFETTLNIVDPTADRTVSLPNQDGVLAILSPSLSDSELATAITAAPAEINLLDAGAGSSVGLASGDGLIIFDASDSDSGKKVLMSDVATYVGDNLAVSVTAFGDANATLAIGINYASANPSANRTLTLPASPSVGQSVKVKAPADLTNGNLIISRAGSQTIDGETSITLESAFAAVELIYVASDLWRVF